VKVSIRTDASEPLERPAGIDFALIYQVGRTLTHL
jgi:hypothetical protein